ncbi:hypothetical protein ACFL35_01075 [Candidatus Riflebacteria bacterium]
MTKKRVQSQFTFLEVLITVTILGFAMASFIHMFYFGKKVSVVTEEEVVAMFLVVDKLEEIQSLPFSKVQGDYEQYRRIFLKDIKWKDRGNNPNSFYREFSDIWTPIQVKEMEKVYDTFLKVYKEVAGREYKDFPKEFSRYRRFTLVTIEKDEEQIKTLRKKVTVKITERKTNKILSEMSLIVTGS